MKLSIFNNKGWQYFLLICTGLFCGLFFAAPALANQSPYISPNSEGLGGYYFDFPMDILADDGIFANSESNGGEIGMSFDFSSWLPSWASHEAFGFKMNAYGNSRFLVYPGNVSGACPSSGYTDLYDPVTLGTVSIHDFGSTDNTFTFPYGVFTGSPTIQYILPQNASKICVLLVDVGTGSTRLNVDWLQASIQYDDGTGTENIYTQEVCQSTDVICQARVWIANMFTYFFTPSAFSMAELSTVQSNLYAKAPMAYLAPIQDLDLSPPTEASAPALTLPMFSALASQSGQPYHVIVSGNSLNSLTWIGTDLITLGNIIKPVINIGLWVLYIDFTLMILRLMLV